MKENHSSDSALSVYGQDGLEEFPILKAFQQYVDAEQSKARKRMLALCIFFGALMTAMIAVFLVVLKEASARNQELNDRLVEYAMKNNDRQNVIVQPPAPANDAALKTVAESLAAMQRQMLEMQSKAESSAREAAAPAPTGPSAEDLARMQKIESDMKKIARATEIIRSEKRKLAEEKERLRKQEVEYHRRRMYPEYYEKQARAESAITEKKSAPLPAATRSSADDDIQPEAINYFDSYADEDDDVAPAAERAKTETKKASPKAAAKKPVEKKQTEKNPAEKKPAPSADYFNVPLEINGEASDWLVPAN